MGNRLNQLRQLGDNPILIKELRSRMRGRRAFTLLTLFTVLMSLIAGIVYGSFAIRSYPSPNQLAEIGKGLFAVVLFAQGFLVLFVAPVFTAGAITGERERQTFDLLRTTTLPAKQIATGKLLSGLSFVLLLLLVTIPIQSIAFIMGGISGRDLLLSQLVLVCSAIAYSVIGLFYSSRFHSTKTATLSALFTTFVIVAGIPGVFILGDIFGLRFYTIFSDDGEFLLKMTNLIFTLVNVNSELNPLLDTLTYLVFYTLLAIILFWLTVRRLQNSAQE